MPETSSSLSQNPSYKTQTHSFFPTEQNPFLPSPPSSPARNPSAISSRPTYPSRRLSQLSLIGRSQPPAQAPTNHPLAAKPFPSSSYLLPLRPKMPPPPNLSKIWPPSRALDSSLRHLLPCSLSSGCHPKASAPDCRGAIQADRPLPLVKTPQEPSTPPLPLELSGEFQPLSTTTVASSCEPCSCQPVRLFFGRVRVDAKLLLLQ